MAGARLQSARTHDRAGTRAGVCWPPSCVVLAALPRPVSRPVKVWRACRMRARHALSVLVPDIEHAGFYGLTSHAPARAHCSARTARRRARLRQRTSPLILAVPVQGSRQLHSRWAVTRAIAHPPPPPVARAAAADTLTLRHASLDTAAPHAGRLQLYSQALSDRRDRCCCSRTVGRPGPSMPTAWCAISKCAPTTSRTIQWSARAGLHCA